MPVGKDQVQHVEMAQDMAAHFNEQFGHGEQLLRRPEWRLSRSPYVPGLDGAKMSKSYDNTIPIWSTGKDLRKRIGRIVTDSTPLGQPLPIESDKVLALLDLMLDDAERARSASGIAPARAPASRSATDMRSRCSPSASMRTSPTRERGASTCCADPGAVEQLLRKSAVRARELAQRTLERCRIATGLR